MEFKKDVLEQQVPNLKKQLKQAEASLANHAQQANNLVTSYKQRVEGQHTELTDSVSKLKADKAVLQKQLEWVYSRFRLFL